MKIVVVATGLLTALAGAPPVMAADPSRKTISTEAYQPVCGTRNGERKTYSNRCFAGVDQATDIADGPCSPKN